MADLFPAIEERVEVWDLYDQFRRRFPWRLVPHRIRRRVFGFLMTRS